MKTTYNILRAGLLGIFVILTSCGYEDPIGSTVTIYPIITLNGDDVDQVAVGETYDDPSAVATIDDTEVPVEVTYTGKFTGATYTGTLNTSMPDIYTATYSAENSDGFSGSATRQVIVSNTGDLVNSIEGVYLSTVARNGTIDAAYIDMEYVLIWQNEDGSYELSDAFGGYYDIGRVYGVDYITPGALIIANDIPSNDFEYPNTVSNLSFGGSATIAGMTVDPDAGTIDYTCVWQADASTTYTFDIHLEQVQF